jgi:hypothetical protein
MSEMLCNFIYSTQILHFLCVLHREKAPNATHHPATAAINLAPDWLGIDVEVWSLCFLAHTSGREIRRLGSSGLV